MTTPTTHSPVTGLKFALMYVDRLATCQPFYEKYLGFTKTDEFRPGEIYGNCGSVGMWIGEGYKPVDATEGSTRATVMLGVESVGALFKALKDGGERLVQEAPVEMQKGTFWLQFADPAGNIIDVLGPA
jgi:predicted enzyme related to lactoylglutathione lyase